MHLGSIISRDTPVWVNIPGADGKPDARYLVFRRKLGEDKQDLLVAINGGDTGIISDVDLLKLSEKNEMGREIITIEGKDGKINNVPYHKLVSDPESSLNVLLYRIPSEASSESDKA